MEKRRVINMIINSERENRNNTNRGCSSCPVIGLIQQEIRITGGNPMIHLINISEQHCHCGRTIRLQDLPGMRNTENITWEG